MANPPTYNWKHLFIFLAFGLFAFCLGLIAGNKTACINHGLNSPTTQKLEERNASLTLKH